MIECFAESLVWERLARLSGMAMLCWVMCLSLRPIGAAAEEAPEGAAELEPEEASEGAAEGEEEDPQSSPQPSLVSAAPPVVTAFSDRIVSVEIRCDIPFCDEIDNVEALKRVTTFWPGQVFDEARLAVAARRLLRTGFFATVEPRVERSASGYQVVFFTEGQPLVRNIVFKEVGDLFESEIKKRLVLRSGRPLLPRSTTLRNLDTRSMTQRELAAIALTDQASAIERLYQREGYFDAVVDVREAPAGPYLADVIIDVDAGIPYALGRVYARGHSAFSYEEIESSLRAGFGFFSNFTFDQLERGLESLTQSYRRAGFIQVRINHYYRKDKERGQYDIFLDIEEGRRWAFSFSGNRIIDEKELLNTLTFFEVGYIDVAEVSSSIAQIKARYETVGHYWAEVSHHIDTSDANLYRLTITIDEGPQAEIERIHFDGAVSLSHNVLRDAIRSTAYQPFGTGAYPQLSLIADDAGIIVDVYRERGYLLADVTGWSLTQASTPGRLLLTFFITEGPLTTVQFKHVHTERSDVIARDIRAIEGQVGLPFNALDLRTDQTQLLKTLRAQGFARATVEVSCTAYDNDSDEIQLTCETPELPNECFPPAPEDLCQRSQSPKGPQEVCRRHFEFFNNEQDGAICRPQGGITGTQVDVDYGVSVGEPHFVGDFFIHGNFVTANWVIKQDFPFDTSDPFDFNKLLEARSNLRARAIYESVTVETIGIEDEEQQRRDSAAGQQRDFVLNHVPLVVHVEEGLRRWLDLALGATLIAGEWLATAELEFVEANLLGTGWEFRILLLPEARFLNFNGEFVLAKPFNQNWFSLATFQIPVSPVSGIDLLLQAFYDLRYIPETKKEEQGGIIEVRWSISRSWFASLGIEAKVSSTASFSGDMDSYDPCYPVTFFQDCPFDARDTSQTYAIIPRTLYDARNSPLNPTRGYYLEGRAKLGYSEQVGFFAKPDLRGSFYTTFLRNFTVGINARVGASFHRVGAALPLFDRFFLGGINVRGFTSDAVGPRRVDPEAPQLPTNEAAGGEFLLNLNTELRFPIVRESGLFGVLFIDSGALLVNQALAYGGVGSFADDLFLQQMRYTAGIGLRWLIAENLPPIVLDYGLLLNRRPGEPFGGFNLNVGYTF